MDDGSLGYQKRSGERRTLRVVVHSELGVNVVLGRSRPAERRKNDAMREVQSTDLEGSEESRRLDGRGHLSLESSGSSSRSRVFRGTRSEV